MEAIAVSPVMREKTVDVLLDYLNLNISNVMDVVARVKVKKT